MKRLFVDIETSPNVVWSWRLGHKISLDSDNLLRERKIIMLGYMWEDEEEASVVTWDKAQNDKPVVKLAAKLLDRADEVVTHNGDRFDLPWLRTRAMVHGVHLTRFVNSVDTLKLVRGSFYLNSNRLKYVTKFLNTGGKIKTDVELWTDVVFNKSPVALDKMMKYCATDVEQLAKVWRSLVPYTPAAASSSAALDRRSRLCCPVCSTVTDGKRTKRTSTPSGYIRYVLRCRVCSYEWKIPESIGKKGGLL